MNWLTDVSWLAGPLLQITLLIFILRHKLHRVFPRFFSYILFQVLKSACLFVAYRYFAANYFDAYWTGNAISVFLSVGVMDEVLHNLFKEYGGIQTVGVTIFRWACGLLLVLAIVGAVSTRTAGADTVVATVFAFDRSVRIMQCGFCLLLLVLSRVLRDCWRQPVFGIALGFGLFASIELILVSIVMWQGDAQSVIISLAKSTAYNFVTLLWIVYLRREPEPAPAFESSLDVKTFDFALATPPGLVDHDPAFMLMVEQAVGRVLSRTNWPKPKSSGPRIVARKPNPEEGN